LNADFFYRTDNACKNHFNSLMARKKKGSRATKRTRRTSKKDSLGVKSSKHQRSLSDTVFYQALYSNTAFNPTQMAPQFGSFGTYTQSPTSQQHTPMVIQQQMNHPNLMMKVPMQQPNQPIMQPMQHIQPMQPMQSMHPMHQRSMSYDYNFSFIPNQFDMNKSLNPMENTLSQVPSGFEGTRQPMNQLQITPNTIQNHEILDTKSPFLNEAPKIEISPSPNFNVDTFFTNANTDDFSSDILNQMDTETVDDIFPRLELNITAIEASLHPDQSPLVLKQEPTFPKDPSHLRHRSYDSSAMEKKSLERIILDPFANKEELRNFDAMDITDMKPKTRTQPQHRRAFSFDVSQLKGNSFNFDL
jgi:hypothetical protein